MSATERVTVTLPTELLREVDRFETNRSKFIQVATRFEVERRRRELLDRSLQGSHADTAEVVDQGFQDWVNSLPDDLVDDLVDTGQGSDVRWVEGEGWHRVRPS